MTMTNTLHSEPRRSFYDREMIELIDPVSEFEYEPTEGIVLDTKRDGPYQEAVKQFMSWPVTAWTWAWMEIA